jgi:Arc/MetJ-type ribon-helix-helix transcriptional regulator
MTKQARARLQLNVELTQDLADRLEKHVEKSKRANKAAVVKKADVIRELLDGALTRAGV